jgi:hypothetical protein
VAQQRGGVRRDRLRLASREVRGIDATLDEAVWRPAATLVGARASARLVELKLSVASR